MARLKPASTESMDRPTFQEIYMKMAIEMSRRSTCVRLQVGCIITSVDFRRVVSVGYNGNASGLPNECDSETPGACGCFVSGTRILPTEVTRAYRRWYEGEVVRVITTVGDFTGTPNHPVLSHGRGWTPLNLLNKGDHLVGTLRGQQPLGRAPNYQNSVPIEDVFEALLVASRVVRRTGTSHDFHGDGVAHEDVHVVSTDGSLWPYTESSGSYAAREPGFTTALVVPPSFGSRSPAGELVTAVGDEPSFNQPVANHNDSDAVASSNRDGGLPSPVSRDDLIRRQVDHCIPLMSAEVLRHLSKDPSFPESLLDCGVRNPKDSSDGEYGLSSSIPLHEVLHIERYGRSGHVYNLETANNWYSLQPGGIIAHNCLHAEENAVINCDSPRHREKIVFCTNMPCKMCAKRLVNMGGVQKVYYSETYRLREGLDVMDLAKIAYQHFPVKWSS